MRIAKKIILPFFLFIYFFIYALNSYGFYDGWIKNNKDIWYFYDKYEIKKGWLNNKGFWYFLDYNTGEMKTGWFLDKNGKWYFLDNTKSLSEGQMKTGWNWIDGYCYYMAPSGETYINSITPDGYTVNSQGQWVMNGIAVYNNKKSGYITKVYKNNVKLNYSSSGSGAYKGIEDNNIENNKNEDENKEKVNVIKNAITIADYKKSNIIAVKKETDSDLYKVQEEVFKKFDNDTYKSNLYFLDLNNYIFVIDTNNILVGEKNFNESDIFLENAVYYADETTNNILKRADENYFKQKNNKRNILLFTGDNENNNLLNAEYILGIGDNKQKLSVAALDNTKEIAGINFVSDENIVSNGANNAFISLKSSNSGFDCNINNNTFKFKDNDNKTQVHRAIGIFSVAGNLHIENNKFEGRNIKNGSGSNNIHGMIDCQNRLSFKEDEAKFSNIVIKDNSFKNIYTAGIILYASDREYLDIEDNVFDGTGEEAVKIFPVIISYPKEHNIVVSGNKIKNYGLNINKGYTDGGYGPIGEVNTGEYGIYISYYNGTQKGSKVNNKWHSSIEQLEKTLKEDNEIQNSEENNNNSGVIDSKEVLIGQKDIYIDTAQKINKANSYAIKGESLVIVKDKDGDVIYGQDSEYPTSVIIVNDLYITGTSSGTVTLPATLMIKGNLKVDLPNGRIKIDATVKGSIQLNTSKIKNQAVIEALNKEKIPYKGALNDFKIAVKDIKDDFGNIVDDSDLNIKILLNKNILDKNDYTYENGIISIKKEVINGLDENSKIIVTISKNGVSEISSQIINIEFLNLSSASFTYERKDLIHFSETEDLRISVNNLKNNKGELISKDISKLKGNIDILLYGTIPCDKAYIDVDDETDTIIIKKELLNSMNATEFTNIENKSLGSSGRYTLRINDAENEIYNLIDEMKFNITDNSSVNFEFTTNTFTYSNAPISGITLKITNVRDASGKSLSAAQTKLVDENGYLNVDIETFPAQRDLEFLVLRDEGGEYIKEYFNPEYLIVDDDNDTITFTKEYLDKIVPGDDNSTEHGIKIFNFIYRDSITRVEYRGEKMPLYIKYKEKELSKNTEIDFIKSTYKIENNNIIKEAENKASKISVASFLKSIIKHNTRQKLTVIREGKELRYFDSIKKGDKLKVVAENGIDNVVYDIDFESVHNEELYKSFNSSVIDEIGVDFIIVNSELERNPTVAELLSAITLYEGVSVEVVKSDTPVVADSNITNEMKLVFTKNNIDYIYDIRLKDGSQYRALLIGNQDYGNPKMNLSGPENDLKMMGVLFKRMSFDGERLETLNIRKNVTKEEFIGAIRRTFSNTTDEDISYIYYSGHGYNLNETKTSYICTVDKIPEDISSEEAVNYWISVNELKEELDKIKGIKVLILDCCNAGGFIDKEFVDAMSHATGHRYPDLFNEGVLDSFADSDVTVINGYNIGETRDYNSDISIESNNTKLNYLTDNDYKVLVASSANEYSFEDKKQAVGKFTLKFVEGAGYKDGNKLADENGDNCVSLSEMYDYLMDNVASVSHIQVFPQKDEFILIKDVDENDLDDSTLISIKNNVYKFNYRKDKKDRIIGSITSNIEEINTELTAGEFLDNIEKTNEAQRLSLLDKDKQEYDNDDKLKEGIAYLRVVAENGNFSDFSLLVKKYISNEENKKIDIISSDSDVAVKIVGRVVYTIKVTKKISTEDFINLLEGDNPDRGLKLYSKGGVIEKNISSDVFIENYDVLEVTSKDGTVSQKYNITVFYAESENDTLGEGIYIIEDGVIKSGTKKLNSNVKVAEILNLLMIKDRGKEWKIHRNGSMSPFMIKRNDELLDEGDIAIGRNPFGSKPVTYTFEFSGNEENGDSDELTEDIESEDIENDVDTGTSTEEDDIPAIIITPPEN